ncbi:hypothetical protein BKA66DRAFT_571313 [Pyrenochaeta sp. MPI-SDFR-AT-0127]|nr:hypothetical protein BKA66DRAFT_571313 [Pyrenochaeta sp. MPI-SDFR-AT-0127]
MAPTNQLGSLRVAYDEHVTDVHHYAGRSASHSRKERWKAYVKTIWKAITKTPSAKRSIPATRSDTWSVPIDVAIFGNLMVHEFRIVAIALFDSQCKFDMISTSCAARLGLSYENAIRQPFSMTITRDTIYTVAEVDLRWHCNEAVQSSASDNVISFLPLFYDTRFLVIESDCFDIIIGHPTLERLNLYERKNNIIAPFRPLSPKVAAPSSLTAAQQTAADKEREMERLRTEQDERQRVRGPSI